NLRIRLRRPLTPSHTLIPARNTRLTQTRKHRPIHTRSRRCAKQNLNRITRRSRRNSWEKRCLSVFPILLRLIAHKNINSEATARPLGPGDELNRATILKNDRFLAIGLTNTTRRDHSRQLRVLTLILKERQDTEESLTSSLHLVRSMKNLQTKRHHEEQLNHFKDAVLAVLARNRDTP